jgi:hypothetical protein
VTGAYLYDALNNLLLPIVAHDLRDRALTPGQQRTAAKAHNCDRSALAQCLGLRTEQRVLFAQSIGYSRA